MASNIESIYSLIDDIKSICTSYGVNTNEVEIQDCLFVLKNSALLVEKLTLAFKEGVKTSELYGINDLFVSTVVDLFIDEYDIVVEDDLGEEFFEYDEKHESLDALDLFHRDMRRYSQMTEEEEKEIFTRYSNGEVELAQEILNRNLRLVDAYAARKASNRHERLDFIQDGCLGMMKAIEKFDVNLGFKFSTYATWYLRRYTDETLSLDTILTIPKKTKSAFTKYFKKFNLEYGRKPTPQELAQFMDIPLESVFKYLNFLGNSLSLNQKIEDEEASEILDFVSDETFPNPEHQALRNISCVKLIEILRQRLKTDEFYTLVYRYGLDGNGIRTEQEIASYLNVSKMCVTNLERTARKKLALTNKEELKGLIF